MRSLVGYFDAAGHPDGDGVLSVAGYVSLERKWERLTARWNKVLTGAGIACPFHMTDFVAGTKKFASWRGKDDERAALVRQLVQIVKRDVYKSFAESVVLDDWRKVNHDYALTESRCTPFAVAAFYVMDRAVRWWGKAHPNESIDRFVFEEGDRNKGDFMWFMDHIIRARKRELRSLKPYFEAKRLAPLQAADLAAWTLRRSVQAWVAKEPIRTIPNALKTELAAIANIPHEWGYLDEEKLLKFCRDFNVPKRGEDREWQGIPAAPDVAR